MEFNHTRYRYPSRRESIFAKNGMVCTSQPLAAQAGLDILKQGGTAVDAAVAAAAAMTVLEPTSNGIGADAFALVWLEEKKELYGLNASGRAPRALNREAVKSLGHEAIPARGWLPVMVPGAPSAWAELTEKFGRLTLEENLKPAIAYAQDGYPVTPVISQLWQTSFDLFQSIRCDGGFCGRYCGKNQDTQWLDPWFAHFAREGRPPGAGELWESKEMADTLKRIASSKARDFYTGELAGKIDEFSRRTGGFLRKEDLEDYWCDWVKPIHVTYRGYDVWEIPPNGDGIIALMALNILKHFDFPADGGEEAENCHRQMEAMKLAFADGSRFVSDQDAMTVTAEELLSEKHGMERSRLIGEKAMVPAAGDPDSGGTVYLCTADRDGNMVSFIQSNYNGFGSGVVVPGTGIALQNRGCAFSMDENSDNRLEPGKKVFHTIIPGFLTRDGEAVGPFGVMGAFMQPYEIEVAGNSLSFGRGEMIWKDHNGVYCGAAEPRACGYVAAW